MKLKLFLASMVYAVVVVPAVTCWAADDPPLTDKTLVVWVFAPREPHAERCDGR